MKTLLRILGIVIVLLSLLVAIAVPPAGIAGIIFGIVLVLASRKKPVTSALQKPSMSEKLETLQARLSEKRKNLEQNQKSLRETIVDNQKKNKDKAAEIDTVTENKITELNKYNQITIETKAIAKPSYQIDGFQFPDFVIHEDIKNLLWIADGKYKNYTIGQKEPDFEYCGMKIYFSFGSNEEPSLIYSRQPIQKPHDETVIPRPPYYPTYSGLTPEQRYIYAKLLTNPYNTEIDIGYVFILYYGLERHLLCGDFDSAFKVILKLRDVHRNGSFQSYSANALILTSMLHNRGEYALAFIASLDKEYEFNFLSNLFLICYFSFDLPLTPKDIMRMSATFEFTNRNYIKKNPDIFEKCLSDTIADKYQSDGVFINTFITKSELSKIKRDNWRIFANMSLLDKEIPVPMLSDNFKLKKAINDLLNEAHERTKKALAEMRKKNKAGNGEIGLVVIKPNEPQEDKK